jgi:alpha-glucosidase
VPNHTSDQHPWFVASRSSRDDPKRDWYIWRDGDELPNNWEAVFPAGPAWTRDEATQSWYFHLFTAEQPDLNWANPEVVAAMLDTLRFWLDRGVDGFRMDVVHAIGKPEGLPDRPTGPGTPLMEIDEPATHDHLREIRAVLDGYPGERMSVGEVYLLEPERVADYYGDDDELHLSFNFAALWAPWEAAAWQTQIEQAARAFDPVDAWPTWVLSNHDVTRHRQRYGGDERTARAAAVLLLGLRGTPFLYAGEELGLLDTDVPTEQQQDPSGQRDGCRAPIPWNASADHGWAGSETWLPFPPESDTRNAASQRSSPGSIGALYRAVLAARRSSPALRLGAQALLDTPEGVVGWERRHDDGHRVVLVNMTDGEVSVAVPPPDAGSGWVAEVWSTTATAGEWTGALPPHGAVVLRPTP